VCAQPVLQFISLSNEMHVCNICVSMVSLYSTSSVLKWSSLCSGNWLSEIPLKTEDLGPQTYDFTGEDRIT